MAARPAARSRESRSCGRRTEPGPEQVDRARLSSALGSLLRNGSAQIRPLAARAIGALGLSSLEGDLERCGKEAGREVQRARERWIKSPKDEPSLFSPDPPAAQALWAEAIAAELRLSVPDAPGAVALLAHDPAAAVRVAGAESVPWLPAGQQWTILQPLLEDPDPGVRQAARAVLPRIDVKAGPASAWLLTELAQATPEADGAPLVEALSHLEGLPGLEKALEGALDRPDTAPAAANVLATVADPAARAAILSRLKQPFALALPELLQAVTRTAPDDPDRAAIASACRTLLFHTRPEVRAAAVLALKAIDGAEARGEVQALAVDYDVRVRRAVASP